MRSIRTFPYKYQLSLREKVIAYPDDCCVVRKAYRNIAQWQSSWLISSVSVVRFHLFRSRDLNATYAYNSKRGGAGSRLRL